MMFFPDCSTVIRGVPRLVVGAPRLVAGALRCSQACNRCSQACCRRTQVLPGAPEDHCIGPVNAGILPSWDSGPTTLRHSQTLPVTKIHFADVLFHTRIYSLRLTICLWVEHCWQPVNNPQATTYLSPKHWCELRSPVRNNCQWELMKTYHRFQNLFGQPRDINCCIARDTMCHFQESVHHYPNSIKPLTLR